MRYQQNQLLTSQTEVVGLQMALMPVFEAEGPMNITNIFTYPLQERIIKVRSKLQIKPLFESIQQLRTNRSVPLKQITPPHKKSIIHIYTNSSLLSPDLINPQQKLRRIQLKKKKKEDLENAKDKEDVYQFQNTNFTKCYDDKQGTNVKNILKKQFVGSQTQLNDSIKKNYFRSTKYIQNVSSSVSPNIKLTQSAIFFSTKSQKLNILKTLYEPKQPIRRKKKQISPRRPLDDQTQASSYLYGFQSKDQTLTDISRCDDRQYFFGKPKAPLNRTLKENSNKTEENQFTIFHF